MDTSASGFVLDLYRQARRLAHAPMRQFVFQGLQQVVPFDSAFWYRWAGAPDSSQLHDWCLFQQPASLIEEYVAQELWRDDVVYARALTVPSCTAVCASYDDYTSPRMRNFLRRHRQEHVLTIALWDDVQGIASGMSLYRNETRSGFGADDCRRIEVLMPHAIEAWRENWLQEVVRQARSSAGHEEFSLAVVLPELVLSEAQHHFGTMLQLQWPDWRGPRLPPALHEHLQRRPDESRPWLGPAVAVYHRYRPDGALLLLVRRAHAFDLLPARKREAAVRFARGASQTDVAQHMRLSSSTVNNYLGVVYEQLQISDKTELARLVTRLEL